MQASEHTYMGLLLTEALKRLSGHGIEPTVTISSVPRRLEHTGELRVVRQNADGSELIVCAFQTRVGDVL